MRQKRDQRGPCLQIRLTSTLKENNLQTWIYNTAHAREPGR